MRISGITLPDNKRMEIALTAVFGIGRPRAHTILKAAGVDFGKHDVITDPEGGNLLFLCLATKCQQGLTGSHRALSG